MNEGGWRWAVAAAIAALMVAGCDRDTKQAVTKAVEAVQQLYGRNVFPDMSVTWGSYPNNTGHVTANGCFRCHDDSQEAKDGSKIIADCDYCHKQIETPS